MTRILFDHQAFSIQKYGGVSEYFYHLITRIRANPRMEAPLHLDHSNNVFARQLSGAEPYFSLPDLASLKGLGRIDKVARELGLLRDYERLNNAESMRHISQGSFDVFHPTYYDDYFLPHLGKRPYVLTVYDMTHELMPQYFPGYSEFAAKKRAVIERAALLIAISKSTKQDLMRLYGLPARRIVVSHLGPPDDAGLTPIPEQNFVLFVGHRTGYKNFTLFVEALAPLLQTRKDLKIICAGSKPFTSEERRLFQSLSVETRIEHRKIAHESDFRPLYAAALAFVFPSKYEGFGLPLLAALSYGCPVACSSVGSFPEIAGNAAMYFDPEKKDDMHNAVRSLVESPSLRNRNSKLGLKRSTLFSWEKCAQEHMQIYRQFAS